MQGKSLPQRMNRLLQCETKNPENGIHSSTETEISTKENTQLSKKDEGVITSESLEEDYENESQ